MFGGAAADSFIMSSSQPAKLSMQTSTAAIDHRNGEVAPTGLGVYGIYLFE